MTCVLVGLPSARSRWPSVHSFRSATAWAAGPTNAGPTQSVPSSVTGKQDAAVPIDGVSVTDDSATVHTGVTIPAGTGTISVATGSGAILTGQGTTTIDLTGSTAQVNAALAGLVFQPAAGFNTGTPSTPINLTLTTADDGLNAAVQALDLPSINGPAAIETTPAGWTAPPTISNTPDLITGNGSYPACCGMTLSDITGTSLDGGTMTLLLANPVSEVNPVGESIATTLTGLTAGTSYAVTLQWQQATLSYSPIPGMTFTYSGGDLKVTVAGVETVVTPSAAPAADAWQSVEIVFQATAPTETLIAELVASSTRGAIVIDGGAYVRTIRSATATVPINVLAQTIPTDGDETASTPEDQTLTVAAATGLLANATDADGDSLSISGFAVNGSTYAAGATATVPGVGTITVNIDGSYTFTPALDFNGAVPPVTYTVTDGHGGTDTSTLTITVTPVDDPVVPAAGSTGGGELAQTGAPLSMQLALALGAILAGLALTRLRRRTR